MSLGWPPPAPGGSGMERRGIGRGGSVCWFGAPGQSHVYAGCSHCSRPHRHPLGGGPSSPVRGDMVQRVGPTCLEGRGRARTFLSQDAGSVWGRVQDGGVSKGPDFCQRTGKRSPRQPESDRDKPEEGLQRATMRWLMTSGLSPKSQN